MAYSTNIKTFEGATITLSDGGTTSVVLFADKGDINISDLRTDGRDVIPVLAKNVLLDIVKGDRVFPKISFSAHYTPVGLSDEQNVIDFINRTGYYSANVNVLGTGRPPAIKISIKLEGTDKGDASDQTFTFDKCVCDPVTFAAAQDGNTMSFSFVCYGAVTQNGRTIIS